MLRVDYTNKLKARWQSMKQRCTNPKNKNYKDYGGRGISICSEWMNDFESFYTWSINNGFKPRLEIDRKDNDGDYEPSNCRYVTKQVNCNNRRKLNYPPTPTYLITINNETKTAREWARFSGINRTTIIERVKRGISGESLLLPPVLY